MVAATVLFSAGFFSVTMITHEPLHLAQLHEREF